MQSPESTQHPTHGIVLGRFMPPHNGHRFLIDFANFAVDVLTIFLCSLPDEPIPGELRRSWMQELFSDCRIVHLTDAIPEAERRRPGAYRIWAEYIQRHVSRTDFVFASEDYGNDLAAELEAQFVSVDVSRSNVPISGSQIRRNPLLYWQYLPVPVRGHYARHIGVVCSRNEQRELVHEAAFRLNTIAVDAQETRLYTDAVLHAASRQALRFVLTVIPPSQISDDPGYFHSRFDLLIQADAGTAASLTEHILQHYPFDKP